MTQRTQIMAALLMATLALAACGRREAQPAADRSGIAAKITFLELGSTTCIPCKQMQPVMKSVESRYAGQVKVIFHDVMKDRNVSRQYGIKLIPTQIFLDASGKELLRHEGFFHEREIDKFLASQGVTPRG